MSLAVEPLQPKTIGRMNERQILRLIQSHGPLSCADVTRRSGIHAPTVSKAVSSLLAAGLVEEFEAAEPLRGRPAKRLRPARQLRRCWELSSTNQTAASLQQAWMGEFTTIEANPFPTPASYAKLVDVLAGTARKRR